MLRSRLFLKLHPTQLKTTCTGRKSTLRRFSRTSGLANNWIAIAAVAWPSMGIGMNGKLPWKVPTDMAHFKEQTMLVDRNEDNNFQNAVVMGRKTFESIPASQRPLPGRINIILSHQSDLGTANLPFVSENVHFANSFDKANEIILSLKVNSTFVIGGEEIYRQAIDEEYVTRIILTKLYIDNLQFDAYFPHLGSEWSRVITSESDKNKESKGIDPESGIYFEISKYERLKLENNNH